jgi:2-oxoisovalerate dehydrogenase E1 component
VFRPVLSAKGEDGSILKVPNDLGSHLSMDGPKVFLSAVKDMVRSLGDACTEAGIGLEDLSLIVPHQANQRIIEAIRYKLQFPKEKMYSNIRHTGNTSSSSIPLCLERLLFEGSRGDHIGLCAFGGGFTFGGAILQLL